MHELTLRRNHRAPHVVAIGLAQDGSFRITPLAKYPVPLCQALAERFVDWISLRHAGETRLFEPRASSDTA
eukprot:8037275-Heterocapsa_arctica.AAC.1